MPAIVDYYDLTDTSSSNYTDKQIKIIEDFMAKITDPQLVSAAHFLLHLMAFQSEDKSTALVRHFNRFLRELAESGIAEFQCELGVSIIDGDIAVSKGENRAGTGLGWLKKSYTQRYPDAAYALSYFYSENRKGFKKDIEKSDFYMKEYERLKQITE